MAGLAKVMPGMRLGVFGGSFNPPHIGHQILASEALFQFELDRILWVLTPFPPHKTRQEFPPLESRLEMLNAALADESKFELSTVDIDRPPPQYAVDTLKILHQEYPSAALVYLMGSDSLDDLLDWHDPLEFVNQCDELGVMRRPGDHLDLTGLNHHLPGIQERIRFMNAPLLEISSSELRQKIAEGGAYRYYLPSAVCTVIESRALYSTRQEQV